MKLVGRDKITKATLGGVEFVYNPTEFTDEIGIEYTEVKTCGMSYPVPVYSGGTSRNITFDIYLNDAIKEGITRKFISHLHRYKPLERKSGYQFKAPPSLIFSFGWFVKECRLTNMTINYTKFSPELQPIEATVSVTLLILQ